MTGHAPEVDSEDNAPQLREPTANAPDRTAVGRAGEAMPD